MEEAANAPAPSINSRRDKCEDVVVISLYCGCQVVRNLQECAASFENQGSWTKSLRVFYALIRRAHADRAQTNFTASTLSADWLEVEISQIHVAVRHYMHRENIFPFAQADFEKLRSQIPMVPLAPGKRVGRIICCADLQRSSRVLSVHIQRYCSAAVRRVKKIGCVFSRVFHIYRNVEPLSGLGPANIEQVWRRNNLVEGVVVNRIRLPVKLRVGSIDSLMDTKFIQVGPISRVQLSAAVILWIGVVIRDSFAAQVIVSAQDLSRYFLWSALIAAVVIGQTFILAQKRLGKRSRG